ncbi:DUF1508 domain-containing protein [Solitalea lacus]|uniref:DUF1508 domain-containing protein n=1 Tax=Solitalea lacus TaxID=2911172 RepID=UPI001EDB1A38|nr:DUF1508 domain-containing protein [Solitalea lacus]UKJ08342.1 DUF1508 domain-containing protein [Solitalea lacus]
MLSEDYLKFTRYQNQPASEHEGFSVFFDEESGKHYFAMLDDDKTTVLFISEGYPNEEIRDNGIKSVMTNRDLDERYLVKSLEDGRYFLSMRAANNQEIARSNYFYSKAEAQALLPSERKMAKAALTAIESSSREDNYLHCADYEHKPKSNYADFVSFQHEANGQYYFALINTDNKVLLRSEGYATPQGRDNGIESVIKNKDTPERYSVRHFTSGARMVMLFAANRKEIGRSCPIDDDNTLFALFPLLAPLGMGLKIGTKEDDYLGCHEYTGYNADENEIARFEKNNQYYFAWYDGNGKVLLRSEGFETEQALKEELNLVLKYRNNESRYDAIEKAGYRIRVLKDETGREIGRTCPEKIVVVPPPPPPVAAPVPVPVPEPSAGFNWWWILLPLLLLAAFFWWRSCNKKAEEVAPPAPAVVPADTMKVDTMQQMTPKASTSEVRLGSILFDFDSAELMSDAVAQLDKLVSVLENNPNYTAELRAYTDAKGSVKYNVALSKRRAKAAKDYLLKKGIAVNRITADNFGKSNPIAKNHLPDGSDSEQGRHYNRRVEIRVLESGKDVNIVDSINVPSDLKE